MHTLCSKHDGPGYGIWSGHEAPGYGIWSGRDAPGYGNMEWARRHQDMEIWSGHNSTKIWKYGVGTAAPGYGNMEWARRHQDLDVCSMHRIKLSEAMCRKRLILPLGKALVAIKLERIL